MHHHGMATIDSPEALQAWVRSESRVWAAPLASRIALRLLPLECTRLERDGAPGPVFMRTMPIFRAGVVAEVADTVVGDERGFGRAAHGAAEVALGAFYDIDHLGGTLAPLPGRAQFDDPFFAPALYAAAEAATTAATASARAGRTFAGWPGRKRQYDASVAETVIRLIDRLRHTPAAWEKCIWRAVDTDCDWFAGQKEGGHTGRHQAAVGLFATPLWAGPIPDEAHSDTAALRRILKRHGYGFEVWLDWYDRRLAGRPTGFNLPPHADLEIHRRLIAQDDAWWRRDPGEVNAEIAAWIDELTPDRVAADIERLSVRAEIGQADFTSPEAVRAIEALLRQSRRAHDAVAEYAPAGIGHNNPPDSDDDIASGQRDMSETEAKLTAVETSVRSEAPDVRQLLSHASWLHRKIERLRAFSPKGMENFEAEMGKNAATFIKWGAGAVVLELSGVLSHLLRLIEVALHLL